MVKMTVVPVLPLKGKLFDVVELAFAIKDGVEDETWTFEDLFSRVSTGFYEVDPYYEKDVYREGDDLIGETKTDDDVMSYLNHGTDIRRAIMSDDWKSKTTPGRLSVGPGAGQVVRRGYGFPPRPGIEARKWDEAIAKRREKPFQNRIQSIIAKHT